MIKHRAKEHIDTIFWDFDGVILNSNKVRDEGFTAVLKGYPNEQVDALLTYHRNNGGLSRYVKFRYFFEVIRNTEISEKEIQALADSFSGFMRKRLTDKNLLIQETTNFIRNNSQKYPMYIVSGSDQNELRFLASELGIANYFLRIHGSPKPKKQWVKEIIQEEGLIPETCVLIGDSINDYEAAIDNEIKFFAFNNQEIEKYSNTSFQLI